MKKHICLFAAAALMLSACDKDEKETTETPGELKVLEFCPAPGQFVNEGYTANTMEEACAYAEEQLKNERYVSLGAFGGYITVRMPKEVKNRSGYDFGIAGNAFAGSSEPGIVWVSEDTNGNGLPDDVWYELAGSDTPTRGYAVTYYRPDAAGDIRWEDNKGQSGVVAYLPQFHEQMYYPAWIESGAYTLTGSLLKSKTVQEGGIWKNPAFKWGYADNMGEDAATDSYGNYRYNQFDLDDAIDEDGNAVQLEQIHFVKVQSAVLQNAGDIGEVSTEVVGFKVF